MNFHPMKNQLTDRLVDRLLNPTMPGSDSERQDDQLLQILDEPHLWLVRGGRIGVLGGPADSLRAALSQAFSFSMNGEIPGPIVRMPNDEVVVRAQQIYRLWQELGFLAED